MPDFRDLGTTRPTPVVAPIVPPAPPAPPEVRLVQAIESNGCVLTANNAGSVLLAANMTQAELSSTMTRLEELGRVQAQTDGSGIRVLTDRCAV